MKAFSKVISFGIIFIMLFQAAAFAQTEREYADALYELGLFAGTDKGYELDRNFTREEAATILVRLLGEADKINEYEYEEKFTDVKSNRWSYDYVMYCYENGITYGTGEDTFSPDATIDSYQFVTLLLRLMGYEETNLYEALNDGVEYGLFNSQVALQLEESESFTRGDMVYIIYRSLKTKTSDGQLFADCLMEKGVISAKEAEEFDIYGEFENIDELLEELLY